MTDVLMKLQCENKNNKKVKDYANQLLNQKHVKINKYVKFLQSSSVNGLIYAPTQVGKSGATKEFIETCFKAGVPVIVFTDNKTDQQEQLMFRSERDLSSADVTLMKVSDKSFSEDLKTCVIDGNHRFVIFCLDNSIQL